MTEPPRVLQDVYERAGLVPHETEYSRWSVTVSDVVRAGDPEVTLEADVTLCAACGSDNTRCIYADKVFGKEPHKTFELVCGDCGVFSWWAWEAW